MGIFVGRKEYENPPVGLHAAVCCDVEDIGLQETQFGKKHQVRITWQLGELKSDGTRHLASKRYNASLDKRAVLCSDLESWRGRPFTREEVKRVDLEALIGKPCTLQLVENVGREGGTFVNVATVMPLAKGFETLRVDGYVRRKDRPGNAEPAPFQATDEDVPF
jgi:hypothetical protein